MRLGFKEFLSTCVKTFMVYIWSWAMKRNFSRHLEIIVEKIGVGFLSSRIVDHLFYFKNNHFLPERPNKPIFHKNFLNFFVQFPGMTFENTLLVDDMLHKSLFNLPFNAIFLKHFIDHIVMLITCSKLLFFIWNLCICLECGFINL